ncbi:hypothetical protein CP361_08275 [Lactobacillus sp. UMNPBX10]|nr:hypothetical protein CP361_08275 [Lactobacillus sp. UMNPBX10]
MKNIGIIIVTFNPEINDFRKNILQVKKLNQEILIIDNGSTYQNISDLKAITSLENIKLICLNKNKGIGFAQNLGMQKFKNKEFFFFLDQDSYIEVDQFNKLIANFKLLEKKDKDIVMIGPNIEMGGKSTNHTKEIEQATEIISSGSLMLADAVNSVGFMKEEFFIDFIDYEWCWRAICHGKHIYRDNSSILIHETEGVPRKRGHTIDPIFRIFYLFRNSTFIILHENIRLKTKIKLLLRMTGKLVFQIQLDKKNKRLSTAINGIKKGIIGDFSNV